MSGFNAYAAGNKVYRGGSSAAHFGASLDPMGYIERELNKRGGMQSQRRSGWASGALAKMGQGGQGGPNARRPGSPIVTRRVNNNQGIGARRPGSPIFQPNRQRPNQQQNRPNQQQQQQQQSQQQQGAGTIGSDSLSAIKTPVISTATGQLALDPSALQEQADADNAYFNNRIALDNEETNLNEQYTRGYRDLGIQQKDDQRGDLNNFSSRGMAYSSGYGDEVTNSARDFQNAFADILNQKTNALNYVGQQRLANDTFLSTAKSLIARRQAERNAEDAGTLGLDPNHQDPALESAPDPTTPRGYSVPGSPAMSKSAFLKAHPVLANTKPGSEARKRFLANHPGIAAQWARYK